MTINDNLFCLQFYEVRVLLHSARATCAPRPSLRVLVPFVAQLRAWGCVVASSSMRAQVSRAALGSNLFRTGAHKRRQEVARELPHCRQRVAKEQL